MVEFECGFLVRGGCLKFRRLQGRVSKFGSANPMATSMLWLPNPFRPIKNTHLFDLEFHATWQQQNYLILKRPFTSHTCFLLFWIGPLFFFHIKTWVISFFSYRYWSWTYCKLSYAFLFILLFSSSKTYVHYNNYNTKKYFFFFCLVCLLVWSNFWPVYL